MSAGDREPVESEQDMSKYIPHLNPPRIGNEPLRVPCPIMEFRGFNDSTRYNEWREWCAEQRIAKAHGRRKAPKRGSGA